MRDRTKALVISLLLAVAALGATVAAGPANVGVLAGHIAVD
ncbi:hypothetical protein [Herbidospora daliensis]|nr:hypothetical protein [Herbidospora daliensis]